MKSHVKEKDGNVRQAALETLGKLDAAVLATHAATLSLLSSRMFGRLRAQPERRCRRWASWMRRRSFRWSIKLRLSRCAEVMSDVGVRG